MAKPRNNRPVEGKRLNPLPLVAAVRPWQEITDRARKICWTFAWTTTVTLFFGVILSINVAWWWILATMLAGPSLAYVIAADDLHEDRSDRANHMIRVPFQSEPIKIGLEELAKVVPGDHILSDSEVQGLQQRAKTAPGEEATAARYRVEHQKRLLAGKLDNLVMAIQPYQHDDTDYLCIWAPQMRWGAPADRQVCRLKSSHNTNNPKWKLAAAVADLMEIIPATPNTTATSEDISGWHYSDEETDHALRTVEAAKLARWVGPGSVPPRPPFAGVLRGSPEPLLTEKMIRRFCRTDLGTAWVRVDCHKRRCDARNAVVRWLRDGPKAIEDFPYENRAFAQKRFLSNNDLILAVEWLEEKELIQCTKSEFSGNSNLRLTTHGTFYIIHEGDSDVTEYAKHNRGQQKISINGPVGSLAIGDSARQSFTVHGDINVSRVVETLNSAISQLLPSLDPKDREIAERTCEEIVTESRKQNPDTDRLGKLLRTLLRCLASSTMTGLSGVLTGLIKSWLVKLGLPMG